MVRSRKDGKLEMDNHAGGEAGLILRGGVEVSEQVVELDGTNGDEREDFEVDAPADSGGEGVLRGAANEFMGAADEKMRERRNGSGEAKLRAEKIGFQMRVHAQDRSGGIAVIGGKREGPEKFYGAGSLPAVEVEVLGTGWAPRDGAEKVLDRDRGTDVRISAEKLNFLRA